MSPLFWLDLIALGVSVVISSALALTVLGVGVRESLNRAFAVFTLAEAAWAVIALLLRVTLWLELVTQLSVGNPLFLLESTALLLSLMSVAALAFTARYVQRAVRAANVAVVVGVILSLLLSIPLYQHRLFTNPRLGIHGNVINDTNPVAFLVTAPVFVFLLWSLTLFWRSRRELDEPYLALSMLILTLGILLGGVLEVDLPILSFTNTASVIMLGYGVVSRQLFNPLRELTTQLEQRVAERTEMLARTAEQLESTNIALRRREEQFEASAQVVQAVLGIEEEQKLLDESVRLIAEHVGFYHVGIFLIDEEGAFVTLHATSSIEGSRLLARGYGVRVGQGRGQAGVVGSVADQAQARIALDIGPRAMQFTNPDLPETRSQLALPLRVRGEILGVLDLQSREPGAFGEDDIPVYQILADQIAMTLHKLRQFVELRESAVVDRAASYAALSSEAWRELLASQPALDLVRDDQGFVPAEGVWSPQMEAAVQTGGAQASVGDKHVLAVPIKVRDQVIGVIQAHKPSDEEWMPEQVELLETLTEQLGNALDSARLYLNSQRLAQREQLTGQVTARIRESLELDQVLQKAVQEIGGVFGAEAEIRMSMTDANDVEEQL